jgi:phosphate transport system substrate-binding protein
MTRIRYATGELAASRMMSPMRLIALTFVVLLSACAPSGAPAADPLAGSYSIGGGDASIDIVKALTAGFTAKHPGVDFNIDTTLGSDPAVKLAADGSLDLGMASRELTKDEVALVQHHLIGVAGTGLAVNAQNPMRDLSLAAALQIYSGKVTDWSALGGEKQTIIPLIREVGSSARTTFENVVFSGKAAYGPSVLEIRGGDQMRQAIVAYRGAIGIIGVTSEDAGVDGLKLVSVDGVTSTKAALRDGTYKLRRPLYLLVSASRQPKPAIAAFLEFVNGPEGRKIMDKF